MEPIIKYLPKDKIIWCPCDEEWSAYVQLLQSQGFNIVRSSLSDGQDFFTYEPKLWDIIVTNPPFSIKDRIIKRLYELGKPFAVLLPLNSLQGQARYDYFSKRIQLLSFDKRINYHTPDNMKEYKKGSPFASAYFCKDLLPKDLIVEHIEEYQQPLIYEEEI